MAGVSVGKAYVDIGPRLATGFAKTLEGQIGAPSKVAAKQVEGAFGASFKNIAGVAAGTFALVKVAGFFKNSIDAAREANKVAAQTGAVIKSTGGVANVTAAQVEELANSIARKTGIDNEQIAAASNLLLTFTSIRNEVGKNNDIFNQATKIAVDMGKALGGDAASNSILLGKALNNPVQGLLALTRVGVAFTAQQKDQIKAMASSGDLLGAQKIILGELTREFGGSAAAQATAADKMGVAIKQLKEKIGNDLIPVIDSMAGAVSGAISGFDAIPGPVKQAIGLFGLLAGSVFLVAKAEALWKAASLAMAESSLALDLALGPVGIGIAALTAAFLVLKPAALGTEEAVGLFNDALAQTGPASKAAALDVLAKKLADVLPILDSVGVSAGDMANAIIAGGNGTAAGAKQYADFRNHLVDLNVAGKLTNDQFGQLEEAGGTLTYEYDQARIKAAALTAAQKALGIGSAETADQIKAAADAAAAFTGSVKSTLTSMIDPLKAFEATATEAFGLSKVKDELNNNQEWEADYRKLSAAAKAGLEPATKAAAKTVLTLGQLRTNLAKGIKDVGAWEGDLRKIHDRGFGALSADLAQLGPTAAAAVHEAAGATKSALGGLQGQFAERARLIADPTIQAFTDMLTAAAPPIAAGTTAALHAAFTGGSPVLNAQEAASFLGIPWVPPGAGLPVLPAGVAPDTTRGVSGPAGLATAAPGVPTVPGLSAPPVTINVHPAAATSSRQIAADLGDHIAWRLGPSTKAL